MPALAAIARADRRVAAGQLVVGLPVHADGTPHEMTAARRTLRTPARRAASIAGGARRRTLHDRRPPKTSLRRRHRGRERRRDARRGRRAADPAGLVRRRANGARGDLPDAEATLVALAERMRGAVAFDAKFVGIYSGGAWIAGAARAADRRRSRRRVHRRLVLSRRFQPHGTRSRVKRTELPFEVEGATIVLVDDVLYTGPQRARGDQRAVRLRPARRESSSPCWSTAAVASCRSRRPTSARALAVARDLSIVLSRAADGTLALREPATGDEAGA